MGSLGLEVIRLEAPVDRLHGVVYRDLNQRNIDQAYRAGPSDGDGVHRDLIPVRDRIGVSEHRLRRPQQAT
jgi:hypothetical protein